MLKDKKILFVCLGNICRSPISHGIAQKFSDENSLNLEIDSAGTSNWHEGEHPCSHSIAISKKHNLDISKQKSRPIKKDDITYYDYVIAMDEANLQDLLDFGFSNVRKIGDYGGYDSNDVPDPYFFPGFEGFEKVYEMLDLCVKDFLKSRN